MFKKLALVAALLCSTTAHADQEEVFFSPKGGVEAAIVKFIGTAQKSIYVAAYNFTSPAVGEALAAAQARGVRVTAIIDSKAAVQKGNQVCTVAKSGADVRIDAKHPIHHNKYIIVDAKDIETGSFNYSGNAENKNAENALFLKNEPKLAAKYIENFGTHYSHTTKAVCN